MDIGVKLQYLSLSLSLSLSLCADNGGDGLVAARHLSFFGYTVDIHYPKRKFPVW
jgi:hypothetical protein